MAKKPLSGKRWFYAAGARAATQGKPMWLGQDRQDWPQWAKDAYTDGWCDQSQKSSKAERRQAALYWQAEQLHTSAWEGFKAKYPGLTDAELESRGFVKAISERITRTT